MTTDSTEPKEPLLSVRNLTVQFPTARGPFKAVDDVSFDVHKRERVAVVGESGSGKSITMLSILGLVPYPGRIAAGEVQYKGARLDELPPAKMCEIRGSEISLVFQDPMASWNPVLRVGYQIGEAMRLHGKVQRSAITARIVELLRGVGIPSPEQRAKDFPHQFSGGMRQRGMIGMALANYPALLIADEPTTALDVTVQDQVIRLLRDVNQNNGTAILLVTHNLALVASLAERVIVMYAGRILETGTTDAIFSAPQHPYTWGLLRSVPRLDNDADDELIGIPGQPIDPSDDVRGCRFHPRCAFRTDKCSVEEPSLEEVAPGHWVRCWIPMKSANAGSRNAAQHR